MEIPSWSSQLEDQDDNMKHGAYDRHDIPSVAVVDNSFSNLEQTQPGPVLETRLRASCEIFRDFVPSFSLAYLCGELLRTVEWILYIVLTHLEFYRRLVINCVSLLYDGINTSFPCAQHVRCKSPE